MWNRLTGSYETSFSMEIFYTLLEAKVLIAGWRREYNKVRPHSALRYRPPVPETTLPLPPGSAPPGCNGVWTNIESAPITEGRSLKA